MPKQTFPVLIQLKTACFWLPDLFISPLYPTFSLSTTLWFS